MLVRYGKQLKSSSNVEHYLLSLPLSEINKTSFHKIRRQAHKNKSLRLQNLCATRICEKFINALMNLYHVL